MPRYNTKVNIRYQTPYMPKKELPEEQLRLMRREISEMRRNLLRKQQRLKSSRFEPDTRLESHLSNMRLRDIRGVKNTWNQWYQLRELINSDTTSVTGKYRIEKRQIESLHSVGYEFVNRSNLGDFVEFMNYVRDNYSTKIFSSDTVANFYRQHKGMTEHEVEEAFDRWVLGQYTS